MRPHVRVQPRRGAPLCGGPQASARVLPSTGRTTSPPRALPGIALFYQKVAQVFVFPAVHPAFSNTVYIF